MFAREQFKLSKSNITAIRIRGDTILHEAQAATVSYLLSKTFRALVEQKRYEKQRTKNIQQAGFPDGHPL
jgi:hypothetical protein